MPYAAATPYPWPYNGDLRPENTALIVIDMQTDFCGRGGYIDLLGYDISNSRACIEPIQRVLGALRPRGYHIFHTREGHRPDLADLPDNKRWRSRRRDDGTTGATGIGDLGPCGRVIAGVRSGAAIRQDHALEPAIVGFTHGGVHAHVRGDTGQNQIFDSALMQDQLEIRSAEGALARLVDDRLAG